MIDAVRLTKVESGKYFWKDPVGRLVTVENRNDGKRDACWVAVYSDQTLLASGGKLSDVRRKLAARFNLNSSVDPISDLCQRFARAADEGEPWDSGMLGQEIRAIWPKHRRRRGHG